MTLYRLPLVAAFLALPLAASAQQYRPEPPPAVYRSGGPAVMTPPPTVAADPEAPARREVERFRRWYAAAKRPSIMLFWNRELTDETTTRTAEVATVRNETRGTKNSNGGSDYGFLDEKSFQSQIQSSEKSQRILTGGTYANLDRVNSDQFETGFQKAWFDTNVEIVDRSAMMRNLALANKQDRTDLQLLEAAALQQNVQYLIEILPNPSNQSSSGFVFRVRVLHLPSSTVVGQFLSQGMPPSTSETHWVAGPGGFEQRTTTSPSPSAEQIGTQLAIETMSRFR